MSEPDPHQPPPIPYAQPGTARKKGPSALRIIVITLLSLLGVAVVLVGLLFGACLLMLHK